MVHYFKKALAGLIFLLSFSSLNAKILLVNELGDPGGSGSLRNQIAAAAPGDTVMMNVKGVIALNSPITITNKAITILGAFPVHSVIDCSGLGSANAFIFDGTAGGLLTFQGFTITNSNLDYQAILLQGNSQIRIIDCLFENNNGPSASSNGQCIASFISSGLVEIYNCSFINNSSINGGGAIYTGIGGSHRIRNCTFYQNAATLGSNGGAIMSDGTTSISNCTFLNNTAGGNGGSIFQGSGSVELFNNIFSTAPGNVANELFGNNWSNLGGNVFSGSGLGAYSGLVSFTPLPSDQFVSGQANVGINGTLTTDGYGLKYFRLNPGSPCINNGVNPGAGYLLNTDCRRAPRALTNAIGGNLIVDAGAVEFTPFTVTDPFTGANDFYNVWVSNMNTTGFYPGPRYMDFNIPGSGNYTIANTLYNDNLSAGQDWIVDGFTQEGSVIPGPGNTPMDVTPGVFFVNILGSVDLFLLGNAGPNSWISGLKIDNNGGTNYAFETDDANFKFFGNEIICTNGTVASNKPGILIGGVSSCVIGGNRHHERNVISGQGIGIFHQGSQAYIHGNFIGTTPDGMNAIANEVGVISDGGQIDIVGKYRYPSMNVISGNDLKQIEIGVSSFFKIKGNIIGPNYVAGTSLAATQRGIDVRPNTDGEIGGVLPGNTNVIGGHTQGIHIDASNHIDILGNFIGMSPDGTMPAIPNNDGIYIFQDGDMNHSIGDGSFAGRNYISGNTQYGVYVDNAVNGHTIHGNFIGLKPDNTALGNGSHGIFVHNGSVNMNITGNVISGNSGDGIRYFNAGNFDLIQLNKIGTDSTGTAARGNLSGISVDNMGSDVLVTNNLISGNGSSGVAVVNTTVPLAIINNIIGLNASTTVALPNLQGIGAYTSNGLMIHDNTIAGNTQDGIYLEDNSNFTVQGNFIGTNSALNAGLGNNLIGVFVEGSSNLGLIGGSTTGDENVIAYNGQGGIVVGHFSSLIGIMNNSIFENNNLAISLFSSASVLLNDVADSDAIGDAGNAGQNFPDNLVAANCGGGPILAGDIECDQAGNYTLQVFRINPGTPDPSGHGEGNEFITEITLPFNVGNNTFSIPLPGTIVDNDILSVTSTFYNGTGYSTSEFSDTVLVKPQFTANATVTNNVLCFGGSDGVITATHGGSGPFSYSWYDNNTGMPIGQSTIAATVPAGDYYLEISTTTCVVNTNVVNVIEPTQLTVTPSSTNPVCSGNCDGTITLFESGGTAPYQYSINNGPPFQPTNIFTGLCAGAYQYVVTDANGCMTPNTGNNISLTSPPAVSLIPTVTDETCSGMNDGTITLSGSGGTSPYTYQVETSGYTTTSLYTGLASNGYNVFVMDANNCIANGFVTVNPGEVVTANFNSTAATGCQNVGDWDFTDASTSSGSGINAWLWDFDGGNASPSSASIANVNGVMFFNAGIINVSLTVTTSAGCSDNVVLPITVHPAVNADAGIDDAICFGDPFTHTANITGGTGPFVIDWQPHPGHFVNNTLEDPTITGGLSTTPGTYTHTMNVSDINGCISSDVMTLTINANPIVTVPSDYSVCQGDPTTLTATGTAITYNWDNSVINGTPFNPSSTLIYTVIGTDGNGCQNSDQVVITVDIPNTVNAGGDFNVCETAAALTLNGTCSGLASWSSTGTGSYSPNNTALNASYSITPGDVSAGTIIFTLSAAANGACPSTTDDVIVTIDLQPLADAGTLPATECNSNTLSLSGSVNNAATFSWSTDGTGNIQDANLLTTPYSPGIGETGMVTFYLTTSTNGNCPSHVDSVSINLIDAPVSDAGVDNTICSGQSYLLDGTASTNTINYNWYEVAGPSAGNTATTNVSPIVTTSYVLIADNGICNSYDTVTITVVAAPDASFTYGATAFCQDHANILPTTINTPGGTFTMPSSPGSIISSTGEINFSSMLPGTYRVYYTLSSPCTAVDSVDIDVLSLPDATINGTLYVCVGNNQFDLNTNSSLFPVTTLTGGTWSGPGVGGNFFTPGTAGAGSHIITYSVTDGNGCSNSDTALIFIHAQPSVSISGVPNPVCQTDPVFTPIGSPSGGSWLFDGNPVGSSLSIDPDTLTTVTHGISYQYTDPTTGCTATTIPPTGFTVYAVPLNPTTTQPTTQTVCSGATLSLVVSNPNGTGTSLVWYSDAALTNQIAIGPTLNTPVLFNSVTYYVVVQNNGCMSNPIVFNIIVNSANVSAGPDLFICPGTPAQLNVSTSTGTISWSPGTTLNDSTIQDPIATPNVNTTYVVTVINGSCVDYDSVNVVIDGSNSDCGVVPSYNAFSPDGDGVNDNWIIDAVALHPNNHLTIFNRWGDKLVEFEDYDNVNVVWDGSYKGNLLPSGTYYYVIEYLDINIQVSGWLQITH